MEKMSIWQRGKRNGKLLGELNSVTEAKALFISVKCCLEVMKGKDWGLGSAA